MSHRTFRASTASGKAMANAIATASRVSVVWMLNWWLISAQLDSTYRHDSQGLGAADMHLPYLSGGYDR